MARPLGSFNVICDAENQKRDSRWASDTAFGRSKASVNGSEYRPDIDYIRIYIGYNINRDGRYDRIDHGDADGVNTLAIHASDSLSLYRNNLSLCLSREYLKTLLHDDEVLRILFVSMTWLRYQSFNKVRSRLADKSITHLFLPPSGFLNLFLSNRTGIVSVRPAFWWLHSIQAEAKFESPHINNNIIYWW